MNTVLVTGANRGMGLAYVRHYLDENRSHQGWRVIACCRSIERADALHALADEHGDRLVLTELDVADESSIAGLAERLSTDSLSLVINNAGVSGEQPLGEWTAAAFEEHLRINTIGPALVSQAVAPRLADGAKLINISSGMGSLTANPNLESGLDAYAASKAALNLLTIRLAAQLRSRGVVVVALNPGWVRTEMGGPDAPSGIEETVAQIVGVIDCMTFEQSGRFLEADGSASPW